VSAEIVERMAYARSYSRKVGKINEIDRRWQLPVRDIFSTRRTGAPTVSTMKARHHATSITAAILGWLSGCHSGGAWGDITAEGQLSPVTVECAATSGTGSRWTCPQNLTLDCRDLSAATFEVQSPASLICSADALSVAYSGPLTPGKHNIALVDAADQTLCSSEVTIVQSTPVRLVPKLVQLWPPNHKLHEISVADCVDVQNACPGDVLEPEFVWASSDEPIDAHGDGHHSPDIVLADDCKHVAIRSERQGPKDGRVYKLGVRLTDRTGRTSEVTCEVIVDHDQRGVTGADSGEAYRVLFNGAHGGPVCDGVPPQVPPVPPSDDETPDQDLPS